MLLCGLFALAALVIAIPALAATSPKKKKEKRPNIPSCTRFSRAALAKALDSDPLKFKDRIPHSNLCLWEAKKTGHYRETVGIGVYPGIKSVYAKAESAGIKTATKEGKSFGRLSSRHEPWKAAFFVSGVVSAAGLEACPPKHKLPKFGPPQCSADPAWITNNVTAYNSKLMVTAAADAQQGDVHLSHVIELVKQVISGKIR